MIFKGSVIMPAPTRKVILAEQHIERALVELPDYVTDFVRAKKRNRNSPLLSVVICMTINDSLIGCVLKNSPMPLTIKM